MTGGRNIRHTNAERGLDLYETPSEAIHALLEVEKLPHWIWEPAAGRGAIVNVLRDRGHAAVASDIHDYGFPLHFVADFLTREKAPVNCGTIVTNPPFQIVNEFVRHAVKLCPRVIMLLPLTFYESHCRRNDLLDGGSLARIHAFRNRLPMMHRDGWEGRKNTSTKAYGWFCWDRDHRGPTTAHRISWSAA